MSIGLQTQIYVSLMTMFQAFLRIVKLPNVYEILYIIISFYEISFVTYFYKL